MGEFSFFSEDCEALLRIAESDELLSRPVFSIRGGAHTDERRSPPVRRPPSSAAGHRRFRETSFLVETFPRDSRYSSRTLALQGINCVRIKVLLNSMECVKNNIFCMLKNLQLNIFLLYPLTELLWYFRSRDQGQKERWDLRRTLRCRSTICGLAVAGSTTNLVSGILKQLDGLANGSALIVPLDSIGEMSLPGLRSCGDSHLPGRIEWLSRRTRMKKSFLHLEEERGLTQKRKSRLDRQYAHRASTQRKVTIKSHRLLFQTVYQQLRC